MNKKLIAIICYFLISTSYLTLGLAVAEDPKSERKILYYKHPMGLPDTSPVPKKDSMNMDYIPVYEGEDNNSGTVKISLNKVQKLGVKVVAAKSAIINKTIRAVGVVQVNEKLQHVIAPRFEGWVEILHANTTGQNVIKGKPLMEVYSPEVMVAQQEYLLALSSGNHHSEIRNSFSNLLESSVQKLKNLGVSEEQIQNLKKKGKSDRLIAINSPIDGVILEKNVTAGVRFGVGEKLYLLADVSNLWLVIEVFEKDLNQVKLGQEVNIDFDAYSGRNFSGKVEFIYPTLDPKTRTVKVRILLPNKDNLLKPEMFGTATIKASFDGKESVIIPDSAVLDSGVRQIVLIEKKQGEYEPRTVKIGNRGDGYVEILEGLKIGENVVVGANFLIDAESNLKSALEAFNKDDSQESNSKNLKDTNGKN